MITKILFISILAIVGFQAVAQEINNKLSFEFGYGKNTYSMARINEFYIDSFASKPYINLLQDKITRGEHFGLTVRYQPNGLFDFGVYGSYQFGQVSGNPVFYEYDFMGNLLSETQGEFTLRTEAFSIGITSICYISHILKFSEKENKFLKRFHFGLEINAGIALSRVQSTLMYPSTSIASIGANYLEFSSTDFQGKIGVRAEYDFANKPFISTIGFNFGYQYLRTQTVKDRNDIEWKTWGSNPINLDFSGLYFGTYLKIGK